MDEFPRPVPSKVILKLQTRVLQIDCSFPYLAVCTLAAVFLCDLEKEDFTRVQYTKNVDIRSTGLCLMILPERSSLRDLAKERTIPSAKLILFIGEVGSGKLHCCNMEGSIQYSKKIAISGKVSKYSMPVFDPTKTPLAVTVAAQQANGVEAEGNEDNMQDEDEDEEQVNISLGKMLCTDDGMIVSVSSDRLYVYDPYTLNVIAWNEEFKRINNFKIISNYAFIWAGSKLEVVAFSPFRSYAEQLYRAKLIGVLENWIVHTVYSLGWRQKAQPSRLPPLLSAEAVEGESLQSYSPELTNGSSSSRVCTSSCAIDDVAGTISLSPSPALSSACVNTGDKTVQESKAVWNFRKMLLSEGEEESEFTQFVASHVPFPVSVSRLHSCEESSAEMQQEQQDVGLRMEDSEEVTIERPVMSFLKDCQSCFGSLVPPQPHQQVSTTASDNVSPISTSQVQSSAVNDIGRISSTLSHMLKRGGENDYLQLFSQVWKSLLTFYEDIEVVLPQLDYKKSELTLSHVLNASQAFITQPKLVNICEKIGELSGSGGGVNSDIFTKFDDIIMKMILCLYCQQSHFKKCSTDLLIDPQAPSNSNLFMLCFTKFSHCPLVIQWFRELGTSPETLFYDGLLADTLLLLFPLCSTKNDGLLLSSCLDSVGIYDKLPKFFMTWLFLCKFLHKPKQVPYSPLLRSLLNDQLFGKLAEEMFSTIYRDFRLSSFGNAAHYLHHFVSALVLLSKSPECDHPRNVSVLLSCFPLIKWAREDIVTKIIAACHLNPALLGLYLKACLEDGNSFSLCACGLQAGYGSLEDKISPWQRAIEEAIIKLLLEEYFKSSPYDDEEEAPMVQDGNGNGTQKRRAEMLVHMFAMRRGLLEPYFRSPLPDEFLSEEMQAELIVRSGNCASLKYYQCNETNMSLLLTSYRCHFLRRRQKGQERGCGGMSMMISNGASGDTSSFSSNKISKYGGGGASCKRVVDYDLNNTDNKIQSKRHLLLNDFCFGGDVRVKGSGKCFKCSYPLKIFKRNFKPMSRDCLGMWALKQMGSLERLIEVVQTCHLNTPAIFSARLVTKKFILLFILYYCVNKITYCEVYSCFRFYQAVVKFSDGTHQGAGLSEYDAEFGGEHSFTCAIFH